MKMTEYKTQKKQRENNLRIIIKNEKNRGISYKFFIQLAQLDTANFSKFMSGNLGLHKKKLELLEQYFAIESQN